MPSAGRSPPQSTPSVHPTRPHRAVLAPLARTGHGLAQSTKPTKLKDAIVGTPPVASKPSQRVRQIVLTRSGNRCAMSDCRRTLVVQGTDRDPSTLSAKIAHIAGNRPGSPRYDPDMPDAKRNSEDNLIAVCANCHDRIDGQPNTYAVSYCARSKRTTRHG